MSWQLYALVSAIAAGATAIFAKAGVQDVPSHLANAIRTVVVMVLSIAVVFASGDHRSVVALPARAWLFLTLSGIATAVSWVAYFRALALGAATPVAAIDKASLVVTLLLSVLFLGETVGWRAGLGVALTVTGLLLISTS
jgi:transporter family protein